jgi:hypothetical protein
MPCALAAILLPESHLSNFVRKYGFDFAKSSNALRAYVQHILVDMDDMEIDSQTITEESCRTRWSLLDRTQRPDSGRSSTSTSHG